MKREYDHVGFRNILLQVADGDEKAFSKLYDIFYPELTKHVLRKIKDQNIAEDILHDLFLSLWKNRKHITEIESIPAYLYSAVRYLILAQYRQQKTRELPVFDLEEIDMIQDDVPIEDRLYYRYILDEVQREIENLPEKCKEVFKLSRVHHLSIKQIAEEMSISESTAKKHINKAINHLKDFSKKRFGFTLFF
ncbi:RNA polymerase sigma-70 factor, ECF subfamily [Sphingobacterium nematocida]|uniref:RNA polymerase sigma-70 factor, ECF subfamily n=1 Tax=Sphingobacterium nematocida TaxID=1513896 RepID=A0A1T5AYN1_9SPHI|nr:sigma-70 family RNA polymerase sigma factor [Sphingobacterium nematocida]SKB39929.1 RNA polymerase sigma-70 factor, ECF subfamily [Sphingobacterium nematocida]